MAAASSAGRGARAQPLPRRRQFRTGVPSRGAPRPQRRRPQVVLGVPGHRGRRAARTRRRWRSWLPSSPTAATSLTTRMRTRCGRVRRPLPRALPIRTVANWPSLRQLLMKWRLVRRPAPLSGAAPAATTQRRARMHRVRLRRRSRVATKRRALPSTATPARTRQLPPRALTKRCCRRGAWSVAPAWLP